MSTELHTPEEDPEFKQDSEVYELLVRQLRAHKISLLISGDNVQRAFAGPYSSALFKLIAHEMLYAHDDDGSGALFANQSHVVVRGVRPLAARLDSDQGRTIRRVVDQICSCVCGSIRVVAQCSVTGHLWFGRRGSMKAGLLETLFLHVYGEGSNLFG
jgi:hypothetical protein